MLCFFVDNVGHSFDVEWHIGEKVRDCFDIAKVSSVWADGDELTFIENRFKNLPVRTDNNCRRTEWFGDMAKFIVANLE